jgi:tRNA/rRNA methyltransferase
MFSPPPRGEAGWGETSSIGIVFGNEQSGLDNEELALCPVVSYIPANPAFPSYNLSHAAQVYCYELYMAMGEGANERAKGAWEPVSLERTASLADAVTDSLERIGFYRQVSKDQQKGFLKDIFARARLTETEADYVRGIFEKAARMVEKTAKRQE